MISRDSIEVTVNKDELLEKLRINRDIHAKEFDEMYENYVQQAIKGLSKLLKDAKKGNVVTRLNLSEPQSYVAHYDEIIGMLEMSVSDTFKIDSDQFKKYILNQWEWSKSFDMMKATYSGIAGASF